LSEPFLQGPLGTPFIELDTVASTNNYALSQLHAGLAQHGSTFFAHEQTAGKGQRGKTWLTGKKANVLMSVVIDPSPLSLLQQFQLSACIAVSAAEIFSEYAGDETRIKWPNDLYWRDRKAGGILIENIIGKNSKSMARRNEEPAEKERVNNASDEMVSQWLWAVAGIGININQGSFPEDLKNPVSLLQVTGKKNDPVPVAKEICARATLNLNDLTTNGFDGIYARYLELLFKRDEKVKFRKDNRVFEATVLTVLPGGGLLVKHAVEEVLAFGSVEWIIDDAPKKM
jgi:BirA family biotin operon repressor/biotin-[acetyl-CoA-carboxylase] ligase